MKKRDGPVLGLICIGCKWFNGGVRGNELHQECLHPDMKCDNSINMFYEIHIGCPLKPKKSEFFVRYDEDLIYRIEEKQYVWVCMDDNMSGINPVFMKKETGIKYVEDYLNALTGIEYNREDGDDRTIWTVGDIYNTDDIYNIFLERSELI